MFSLSVLVLMTSFVLGISKPSDDIRINNEDNADIEDAVETALESVKAVNGSETDNLETVIPENSSDEESSESDNEEQTSESESDEKEIVKNSGENKVKEDTKTGKGLESEESENKFVTANEKAGNIGNEESESSSKLESSSKKQVRSVTDESVTSDAENKLGLEKSLEEIPELKEEPRSSSTLNVTKNGSADVTSDDKKESSKTRNTELGNDKNQRKVKTEDKLIKEQVRSASKNEDKKTDGKDNADSLEKKIIYRSPINLEKSEIQTIKYPEIPNEEKVFGKTGKIINITNHDISAIKQNEQHTNSKSRQHESFKDEQELNQSAEKKTSISSDTTTSAKLAIDAKDKITSLESHVKDNASAKLIDELTSLKALQKRSENPSLKNEEMVSKTDDDKKTDKTINKLKQVKLPFLLDAPTRRNNPDDSHLLKTTQDKSAHPLVEFSDEDESDTQETEESRSGGQKKIQPGYHKHITDVSIEAKKRLLNFPFNNYNGRAGIPLQNVFLQSYHPVAYRPLPQNFFISPSLRVFRSPTKGIKKIISDETVLPTSSGFPPGFIIPNRPTFPHSGYNPQIIPPFETLNPNILAQNIHPPVAPQTHAIQEFKTPKLQQNQYNLARPKSGNFDNFKDYLNTDDDNPQIEDYTSIDQNAYVYQNNNLKGKSRESQRPTNLRYDLARASNYPEVLQKQGSFHEF